MATNPMQRKARNSFLLGMLVMLLLSSVIIGFLYMQLMNKNKKEKEEASAMTKAYALKQDVSSGQVITADMLEEQTVNKNLVPSNATGDLSIITNYALQDKEGNNLYTKYDDKKNESKLCIKIDNKEYEVKQEDETDNYYYEQDDEKRYLELNSVPLIAKVAMKKNTLITTDLISKGDNTVQNDRRRQEYNTVILPMDLMTGDYIDIRLMLPSGQDYIVISKKEVEIPQVGGVDSADTIWVNLSEDEILHMSCAIIEAYQIKGSKLYATKYTEAGMQEAAIPTYPVNEATSALLNRDPNILEKAKQEISRRYSAKDSDGNNNLPLLRNNFINRAVNDQGEEASTNVEAGMTESATNSKNTRKEYLDSLSGQTVK